jgi:hypothetical protein
MLFSMGGGLECKRGVRERRRSEAREEGEVVVGDRLE